MWMTMDTNNEHGRDQFKLPADPVIGRKLRPLMPRPISSSSSTPYSTPASCCCIRNPNMLSWNHSISDDGVNYKREIQMAAAPVVSTRWNPTPEQLQALEEMYRRGIRTPSADQIQQIAAKLGRFGKIEGKNVFYWFQNHKARERQKKRRQLDAKKMHHQTGLSRRYFEIESHKKVPIPSNCSTASASEDSASMHGAVIAAECGKDGWNHKELQHNIATTAAAENETSCWPLHNLHLHLSSSLALPSPNNYSSSSSSSSSSSVNAITAHKSTGQENTNPYASINLITMLAPKNDHQHQHEHEHGIVEDQTLDLFPTPRPRGEETHHTLTIGTKITPSQFIEFLPIKN